MPTELTYERVVFFIIKEIERNFLEGDINRAIVLSEDLTRVFRENFKETDTITGTHEL